MSHADKSQGATTPSLTSSALTTTPKNQKHQHAADQVQQSAFHKDSPHRQFIDSMNMVVNEASSAIDKEVGPDVQTLNVENALNLFVREGYVATSNSKNMEMLLFKVIPQLQDETGVIQRSILIYYLSALYLATRLPSMQEGSFDIPTLINRYTLPNLLTLAQKTIQLRFNYVAHSLNQTHTQAEKAAPSFMPEINDNAKTLSGSYWNKLSLSSDDVYKRVNAWTEHRNKVREETRQKAELERAADLTFSPSINRRPSKQEEREKAKQTNADVAGIQPSNVNTLDARRRMEDAAALRLYDQGMARHTRIQKLHTEHLNDKMRQELEQCTFSPQIRELKQHVINGSGLVSSTDSHRRSIASAISRMRQSCTFDTPTKSIKSGSRKQSQSLMKTLDLVVSPSPPFSTSRSIRSVTPRGPHDAADKSVRRITSSSPSLSQERKLSTAGLLTEETYSHRNPKASSHSGGYQRSASGSFRPSTCDSFNARSFKDDAGFKSMRSLSRSYSPIHPAREVINECTNPCRNILSFDAEARTTSLRSKNNPARIASFKNYKMEPDVQASSMPALTAQQTRSLFIQKTFFETHNPSPTLPKSKNYHEPH